MDAFLLVLRVGLSLTVVMVLLWMAQKRFSKGGRQGEETVVEVVGRRNVGQKAAVVVIESAGQRFLLGVTEHAINVLHTSDAPIPEPERATGRDATDAGTDAAFDEVLKRAGEPALRRDIAAHRLRHATPGTGPLHGSIFARSTWTQAGTAVRKGLNL